MSQHLARKFDDEIGRVPLNRGKFTPQNGNPGPVLSELRHQNQAYEFSPRYRKRAAYGVSSRLVETL